MKVEERCHNTVARETKGNEKWAKVLKRDISSWLHKELTWDYRELSISGKEGWENSGQDTLEVIPYKLN